MQYKIQVDKSGENISLPYVSLYSLLALLMMLFVITTLLQSLFDRISINKFLGFFIAIMAFALWSRTLEKRQVLSAYVLLSVCSLVVLTSSNTGQEAVDWMYFFISLLLLSLLCNPLHSIEIYKAFYQYRILVKAIIWISTGILFILLASRIGYKYKWGEGSYFVGLCNSEHTLASVCCLIMALIYFYVSVYDCNKLCYGILFMIPAFGIFQSGARIFLVPVAIMGYLFIRKNVKIILFRYIIYAIGGLGFAYVLINSSMMEKFLYAFDNQYGGTVLDAFTSGRTEIWATELQLFVRSNILKKIFGGSFAAIYTANKTHLGLSIGAHNDMIGLLCGTGIIGLSLYIYVLASLMKRIFQLYIPMPCRLLLCAYVIVPLLFNGFYPYQHYVYSFVILFLSLQDFGKNLISTQEIE